MLQIASADPTDRLDSSTPAIETTDLRKRYGSREVLHGLTLSVSPGEVFGFLGPNGAGKSTTMKILAGLVRPTSGEARLLGGLPMEPATRRSLGYLPEQFRFHGWQTGAEMLELHGQLAGMAAAQIRERIPKVLEEVGLSGRGWDHIGGFSKGMTQRIGIAQAILADPRVVLLDEPTSALDPVGRREIRDLVRRLKERGVTVFINSHLLTEIELVCDRVAIVDQGRVVRLGRLSELLGGVARIRVETDRVDRALLAVLARHGEPTLLEGGAVLVHAPAEAAPEIAADVVRAGYRLRALTPTQQSLEELFVSLVEGGDR